MDFSDTCIKKPDPSYASYGCYNDNKHVYCRSITCYCFSSHSGQAIIKNLVITMAGIICLLSFATLYVIIYNIITGNEAAFNKLKLLEFFLLPEKRMDILMSMLLILIGFVLILLSTSRKISSDIAHSIIIPVALISYYLTASYILGIYRYTETGNIAMPVNSGIAIFAICVVVLLMRPQTWFLKVFTSGSMGGLIARQLIPAIMIIPVIIAWFSIKGEATGLVKYDIGVVVVAITYTVCFLILVFLSGTFCYKSGH